MFGNLGMSEILMVLVIVLLVFGAKRLPEIGSAMGKGIREFKRSMREVPEEIDYARAQGAAGIGLYRTEGTLLARQSEPSEDEQYEEYKKVA